MKKCKVEGCNSKHRARGYCNKHYKQFMKYGEIKRTKYDPNEIIVHEDYAEIVIYNQKCEEVARTLIDIDDVDKIKNYKWCLKAQGYIHSGSKSKIINLHRLIMDCPDDMVVDHINHNKLDNRKSNLRICTHHQNSMNISKHSNNTSGVSGINWRKDEQKWVARIGINNKRLFLGYFNTKKEAIEARKQAEIDLFGEYRNKNEN